MTEPRLRIVNETGITRDTRVFLGDQDVTATLKIVEIKIDPLTAKPNTTTATLVCCAPLLDLSGVKLLECVIGSNQKRKET